MSATEAERVYTTVTGQAPKRHVTSSEVEFDAQPVIRKPVVKKGTPPSKRGPGSAYTLEPHPRLAEEISRIVGEGVYTRVELVRNDQWWTRDATTAIIRARQASDEPGVL